MKKKLLILFILIIGSKCLSGWLVQADTQDSNTLKQILINSNIKVNDDVIEFVDIFKNKGIIVGDLFVIGKEVWNDGTVVGDILGANLITNISGVSKGNVRVITQRFEVGGEVYRNVSVITKNFILNPSGIIDGSISVIGDKVQIDGMVSSDIRGKINSLIITGEIKGDVNVDVEKIQFGENGRIHGNLNYKSKNEILMPFSKVDGKITYEKKVPIIKRYYIKEKIALLQALKYLFEFFIMVSKCI